ncbi:tetratricopeptide repeat protein [candidate division WOR-3 bacterium]|nr:tetratricopeptide repeat protein [candidate division WOR-3 bacterium]
MKNLIPRFIVQQNQKGCFSGEFAAIAMFLDIKGFTSISEKLMMSGKEGAEELSYILESIFKPVTRAIYRKGGIVTGFAGDGITAVFPVDKCKAQDVLDCAQSIKVFTELKSKRETKFGVFDLSMKIGVSYGKVEWGSIGALSERAFFFRGEAIEGCVLSEKKCRKTEIVIDEKFRIFAELEKGSILEKNFYVFDFAEERKPWDKEDENKLWEIRTEKEIYENFMSEEFFQTLYEGEFREIVAVFISFEACETYEKIKSLTQIILSHTKEYGGYFSSLDFGDKGGNFLVIFGAPKSLGDDAKRAFEFSLAVRKGGMKIGINKGIVYAGLIGDEFRCNYSFIGEAVTVASRFMEKADKDSIIISKELQDMLKDEFSSEYIGLLELKGKSHPVPAYKLKSRIFKESGMNIQREIVGREGELAVLNEAFCELKENRFGGIIHVAGETGTGKTHLVKKLSSSACNFMDLLVFNCDPILKKAFNPIIFFLKNYFKQWEAQEEKEKKEVFERIFCSIEENICNIEGGERHLPGLKKARPYIGALLDTSFSEGVFDGLENKQKLENTVFAFKDFFSALSLIKPFIMFVDDFQWIDRETFYFLEVFLRGVENYPICIVTASRTNDDGSIPKILEKENFPYMLIILKGLGFEENQKLAKLYMGRDISENLIKFIFEKTQGNPFYVEQLCIFLRENGYLKEGKTGYELKTGDLIVPENIFSVIVARIDKLPPKIKELVQIASVFGGEFEKHILFTVAQSLGALKGPDFDYLIEEMTMEGLLEKTQGERYFFRSNFLRESVYEMQVTSKLKTIHKKAAEIMEMHFGENPEYRHEIAMHYYYAGEKEKAIKDYKIAAKYLAKAYRNREAIECLTKIIEISENEEEKILALSSKTDADFHIGNWDEALKDLHYLTEEEKEKTTPETYKHSLYLTSQIYLYTGDIENSMKTAEKGLSFCREKGMEDNEELFFGIFGQIYYHKGEYEKAMEFYNEQIKKSKENDAKAKAIVLGNIGLIRWNKGEFNEAIKCYGKQIEIFEKEGDNTHLGIAYLNMGSVLFHKNNIDEAFYYYNKARSLCEKTGLKRAMSAAVGNIGAIYKEKGETDKAFECFKTKEKMSIELGDKAGLGLALGNMGVIYTEKGQYEKAMDCFDQKEKICRELKDKKGMSYAYAFKGDLFRMLKDWEKALECYEKNLEICTEIGHKMGELSGLAGIAYVLKEKKETTLAAEKVKEALVLEKDMGIKDCNIYLIAGICLHRLREEDRLKKELADLTGMGEDPEAYFQFALKNLKKKFDTIEYAEALADYGGYLMSVSRTEEGEEFEKKAKDIKKRLQHLTTIIRQDELN